MTEWLQAALPWIVPAFMVVIGWIGWGVLLVLRQVRKINGTVAKHDQWILQHEKLADATKDELSTAITNLESRELERLQAEVVESRTSRTGRKR